MSPDLTELLQTVLTMKTVCRQSESQLCWAKAGFCTIFGG